MSINRRVVWFLALSLIVLVFAGAASAQSPVPLYSVAQRFGVDVAVSYTGIPNFPGQLSDYPGVETTGFGWYSDWNYRRNPERPNGIQFAHLIQVTTAQYPPNWTALRAAILANPRSVWLVGNEPETRGQGERTPAEYAAIYHETYYFIKGVDPHAQVAFGGVVMPSPLRLKWMEQAMQAYQSLYSENVPIDAWHIHMQILQEKRDDWGCGIPVGLTENVGRTYEIIDNCNVDAFKQLAREFGDWLYARGLRNKPAIISEYGVLMPSMYLPYGDQSVLDFMVGTFDFMLNEKHAQRGYPADEGRIFQSWAWFSLNFPFYEDIPGGFNGSLYYYENPSQRTVFGEAYRTYVQGLRDTSTLSLSSGWNLISIPLAPDSTALAQVLSPIAGRYDLVYAYNGFDTVRPWRKYSTVAPPFLNTLSQVSQTQGIWIRTSQAVSLTVTGLAPLRTDMPLKAGWNLVGYPSQVTRPITEALASISGKYDLVYAYTAANATRPWTKYSTVAPPFLNTLKEMAPGLGYWIRTTTDCTWRIDWS